jgi:hypothetical protein
MPPSTKPLSLGAIHRENCEAPDLLALKRQRYLKARLDLACYPHPPWFVTRLLEETSLTRTDLTTVLLTAPGSPVLEDKQLDKLDHFIKSYLAGGITETKGEKVPCEPTIAEVFLLEEAQHQSTQDNADAPEQEDPQPEPAQDSILEPIPFQQPEPGTLPNLPSPVEKAIATGLIQPPPQLRDPRPAEKTAAFDSLSRRYNAITPKPLGWNAAFRRESGCSFYDTDCLAKGIPLHDLHGKFSRIHRTLTIAEANKLPITVMNGHIKKGTKRLVAIPRT